MRKFLLFVAILGFLGYTFRNTEFVKSIINFDAFFVKAKEKMLHRNDPVIEVGRSKFHEVDSIALQTSEADEKNVKTLAAYFSKNFDKDWDKIRAAFKWIAVKIDYDYIGFQDMKTVSPQNPVNSLKTRKAVCRGYAELFTAILKEMGIKSEVVIGYAKGYSYHELRKFGKDPDHAWAAAMVDNKWHLFDPTWSGKGIDKDSLGNIIAGNRNFEEFWFDAKPEEFIYSHFPQNSKFQLLDKPINMKEYAEMPYIEECYFFNMGMPLKHDELKEAVIVYEPPCPIKIPVAPVSNKIKSGQKYSFRIESPHISRVALVNHHLRKWAYAKREKGVFQIDYVPQEGKILLCVEYKNEFQTILSYKAEPNI